MAREKKLATPINQSAKKNGIGVTAIITTYNEEQNIEKCLRSLLWADEVLVVDSYSTDNTPELCRQLGATVLQRQYKYAADQKNWAIPQAKNPWIILLDADEVADEKLQNEIITLLQSEPKYTAYWIKRKNFFLTKLVRFCGWQNDRVVRFFHRDFHRYENKLVHEEIDFSGKIGVLKSEIFHFTADNIHKYNKKIERYAKYAAKQNVLRNKQINYFHLYIKPAYKFLSSYIIRGGILDGVIGFKICRFRARETWLKAHETIKIRTKKTEKDEEIPIDAVITWVDNGDAAHLKKIFEYIPKDERALREKFVARFNEVEELKFVVHSILKYAPFIRTIYIVTDNQRPKFLDTKNKQLYAKVKIIDHKDIFKDDAAYLPVFNSISIETKLCEIPNLSEHFIYFNDDIFLLKPVEQAHFFYNGNPVIRGKWRRFKEDVFYKKIFSKYNKKVFKHGIAQELSAKTVGFKRVFRGQHTPLPMRRKTLKNFFKENREIERKNIKNKFRNTEQVVVQDIANHLEIKNKTCLLLQGYQLVKLTSYKRSIFWIYYRLKILTKKENKLFLNIQELNLYNDFNKKFVLQWLENKYKLKA